MDHIDPRLNDITDALYRVSIKAIIIHDHRLLVTLEDEGWYSLPGGGIEHGSSVEETLKRELEEELGLPPETITVEPKVVAANFHPEVKGIPRTNLYYRVHLSDTDAVRHNELEFRWVSKSQLDKLELSPITSGVRDFLKRLL